MLTGYKSCHSRTEMGMIGFRVVESDNHFYIIESVVVNTKGVRIPLPKCPLNCKVQRPGMGSNTRLSR